MKKKIKEYMVPVLSVVVFYTVLEAFGITCPIKFLTGISCMGCGMSRAWLALLRLDIRKACYYHPLFWTPPLVLLAMYLKKYINARVYKIFILTIIFLYVTIYITRLIDGTDDIVVCHPENNLLSRVIRNVL